MISFEEKTFLIVEDNEDTVLLMKDAFFKAIIPNPVRSVTSLDEAISYLEGKGPYQDRLAYPMPFVLLLDINLAGKDGFEVLTWVRQHPLLKSMVVIILTSSTEQTDADRACNLGANYFIIKPTGFDDFVSAIKCLHSWLRMCHFPRLVETRPEYSQSFSL